MKPVFHERTQDDLSRLAQQLPHAIALQGVPGVGLTSAARYLAAEAGGRVEIIYPEFRDEVDLEKGTITIDIIRRLYVRTGKKLTTPHCIIISAADTMGHSAQNAFLKLLEEPTPLTTFILLVHDDHRLLPTVRSRLQFYQVRPVTTQQSQQLLDRLKVSDEARRRQLLFLAGGRPAMLHRLATDEAAFAAEAALLRQARTLLQGTAYERLVSVQAVAKSRPQAVQLVEYAMTLLQYDIAQRQVADENTLSLLGRLERATRRLKANGNVRLALVAAIM